MATDFYNRTLHEIVKKVFSSANINEISLGARYNVLTDGTLVHISVASKEPRYKDLKDYRYTTIMVFFNVDEDSNAKYGFKKTPESEGFVLWGYLKNDFSDYIPEDFTHYAPGLNNGEGWDNFFRDHLDIPEAKESIKRFKEMVETL